MPQYFFYMFFFLFLIACDKEEIKPSVPQGNWEKGRAPSIEARNEPVIFTVNEEICLGLGHYNALWPQHFNQFVNFDLKSGWNPNKHLPPFPGKGRGEAVAFTIGHKAYVGLGYTFYSTDDPSAGYFTDFWVYDSQEKTWTRLPYDFPGVPRQQVVAFSLNGKGYVGSGLSAERKILGDFYEFDPPTGWKRIADIDERRYGATAFVANGTAYVCLGKTENGYIRHVTKFIPETKTWKGIFTTVATEEGPICINAASFVIRQNGTDYPYIAGGAKTDTPTEYKPLSDCWGLDPKIETWVKVASFPHPVSKGIGFTKEGIGFILSLEEDSMQTWEFVTH